MTTMKSLSRHITESLQPVNEASIKIKSLYKNLDGGEDEFEEIIAKHKLKLTGKITDRKIACAIANDIFDEIGSDAVNSLEDLEDEFGLNWNDDTDKFEL